MGTRWQRRSDAHRDAVVTAFGAVIEVSGADEIVETALRSWQSCGMVLDGPSRESAEVDAHFVVTETSGSATIRLTLDGDVVHECADAREMTAALLSQWHLAVAVHARTALFVHAGAVSWRGRGIVIPGRSMSGKSTLVRALVEAGAAYLSDEYAVLDDGGLLHPYSKPISIRVLDGHRRMIPPDTIGAIATEPVVVRLVVSTRYEPGTRWAPEALSGARAALPLVENTVLARHATQRMLDIVALLGDTAHCVVGPRPAAEATATRILDLVDDLAGT